MHAMYRHGGDRADGYLSRPDDQGPWPGVILLHEWWGLDRHFRELSRRLAGAGFVVMVPDLYDGAVTEDYEEAAWLKTSLDLGRTVEVIAGGADYVRSLPYSNGQVGLLGYCLGGGLALLAASPGEFDALVAYFPSLYPDEEALEGVTCPTLLHYGTADTTTPRSEIERLTEIVGGSATTFEYFEYEGAGHAFMNDEHTQLYHEEAAETSWPRTVDFFETHLTRSEGQ